MVFKLDGLDKLQQDLAQAGTAFGALEDHVMTFDPRDPSSIEGAMSRANSIVDELAGRYPGNNVVKQMGAQIKARLRNSILEKAASSRQQEGGGHMAENNEILQALQGIRDTISDFQSTDYQAFGRHAKKLARYLHSAVLVPVVSELVKGIDLDGWLRQGEVTQGSIIGSAVLDWPNSLDAELGTVILLVDRFAEDTNNALQFAHTFYNGGGNSHAGDLRKMVGSMLVPFERDFGKYARSKLVSEDNMSKPELASSATHINIHNSNIGSVQTGAHSSSTVSVQVNHAGFEALSSSLEALATALAGIAELPHHDKDEILELIADSRTELAKEKPNLSKLRSLLSMIGISVGFVADLGSAFDVVKAAAGVVGVSV